MVNKVQVYYNHVLTSVKLALVVKKIYA